MAKGAIGITGIPPRGSISAGIRGKEVGSFARVMTAPSGSRIGINIGYRGEPKPPSFAGLASKNIFSNPIPNFSPTEHILATAGNGLPHLKQKEVPGIFQRSAIKPMDGRRVGHFKSHVEKIKNTVLEAQGSTSATTIPSIEKKAPEKVTPVIKRAIQSNLESARKIAAIHIEGTSFRQAAQNALAFALVRQRIDPDLIPEISKKISVQVVAETTPATEGAVGVLPAVEQKPDAVPQPDIPKPNAKESGDGGDDNYKQNKSSETPERPQVEFEIDAEAAEERKKKWLEMGKILLSKVPRIEVTAQLLAHVLPDNTQHPKQTSHELLELVKSSETRVPKDGSMTGSKMK